MRLLPTPESRARTRRCAMRNNDQKICPGTRAFTSLEMTRFANRPAVQTVRARAVVGQRAGVSKAAKLNTFFVSEPLGHFVQCAGYGLRRAPRPLK